MEKQLKKEYSQKKEEIQKKLNSFQNLKIKDIYKEFLFCLLTPQSNAQRCWSAVLELEKLSKSNWTLENISKILKSKTRFHNTKAQRVLKAPETFQTILPLLKNKNKLELRNEISKTVNGFGLKEAAHFLRNIGHSNNEISILDRHILKNLYEQKIIQENKIKSPKHYLELESKFLNYSKSLKMEPDHLDLLIWSRENGEIFK